MVAPDASAAIHLHAQTRVRAAERGDLLPLRGLDPARRYRVTSRPQGLDLRAFGHLLRHILPSWVDPTGPLVRTAARRYRRPDAMTVHEGSGATLMAGLPLPDQFVGEPLSPTTRVLGDHGSTLYLVEEVA